VCGFDTIIVRFYLANEHKKSPCDSITRVLTEEIIKSLNISSYRDEMFSSYARIPGKQATVLMKAPN
jgi:hypothetical protein